MITRYKLHYDDLDASDSGNLVRYEDHAAVVAELQSRLESLEKDAARLEFIFSPDKYDHDGIVNLYLEILEGKKPDMSKVRASIDAAMKG